MSQITLWVGKLGQWSGFFKNPLFYTPLSVENQGVAKFKSNIQMYKKSW